LKEKIKKQRKRSLFTRY